VFGWLRFRRRRDPLPVRPGSPGRSEVWVPGPRFRGGQCPDIYLSAALWQSGPQAANGFSGARNVPEPRWPRSANVRNGQQFAAVIAAPPAAESDRASTGIADLLRLHWGTDVGKKLSQHFSNSGVTRAQASLFPRP
jgi:hypothetical protein